MRTLNLVALTLAVVLAVSWLSVAFYPSVQDFMTSNLSWNGLRDFDAKYAAEQVSDLAGLKQNTGEGNLLLVIPYRPFTDRDLEEVKGFVGGGGTLLIMDDYGYGNQVLQALGLQVKFDGDAMLDPYLCYRNKWFPLVTDLTTTPDDGKPRQLVLDHATALNVTGGNYKVLAESSPTSFIDRNGDETYDDGEPKGPFPVAIETSVGSGTVVAVSDPSILINSMVGKADNALFIQQIVAKAGDHPQVLVDSSRLTKSPLDNSKYLWQTVRSRMASPYAQVLLVGAILAAVWVPFRSKGGIFDQ